MNRLAILLTLLCSPGLAGAQSFTSVTDGPIGAAGDASGASWVDYDGDGDFDIYVSNRDRGAYVFQNDGTGVFTAASLPPLTANRSFGSCWADYDNDGDIDAVTAGNPSFLYRNDGSGFSDQTASVSGVTVRGWACAWADYDRDGFADLVVTHPAGFVGTPVVTNYLFHNEQDGTFREVAGDPVSTGQAPYTVATWMDYDEDGDEDLFIGSGPANGSRAPDYLYKNLLTETGTADFERISTAPIATDLQDGQVWRWIDWDNDGDLDAYLTNYWGGFGSGMQNAMYRNDGGEYVRIRDQTLASDFGLSLANVWGDFDNDGDLDVFVANDATGLGGLSRYYENLGEGEFTRRGLGPPTTDRARRWGGVAADMDNDGDLDLFVPSLRNSASQSADFLYRNDLDNDNNWLKVRLTATTSNGSALGAIVRATAGGTTQRRDASSQDSFNGQSMADLHFGLGTAADVSQLQVVWPSGTVDVLESVGVNQTVTIVEGSTATALEDLPDAPELSIYPNPASDWISLEHTGGMAVVTVIDLLGRTVLSGQVERGRLDIAHLPRGVYGVRVGLPGGAAQIRPLVVAR